MAMLLCILHPEEDIIIKNLRPVQRPHITLQERLHIIIHNLQHSKAGPRII